MVLVGMELEPVLAFVRQPRGKFCVLGTEPGRALPSGGLSKMRPGCLETIMYGRTPDVPGGCRVGVWP